LRGDFDVGEGVGGGADAAGTDKAAMVGATGGGRLEGAGCEAEGG
jgi:hypothetical protein